MRVLGAERAARDEVQQRAAEAERLRQAARTAAHRIAERAARRVAEAHRRVESALRLRIDELERQRRAQHEDAPVASDETARLERALARLAAELSESRE